MDDGKKDDNDGAKEQGSTGYTRIILKSIMSQIKKMFMKVCKNPSEVTK